MVNSLKVNAQVMLVINVTCGRWINGAEDE